MDCKKIYLPLIGSRASSKLTRSNTLKSTYRQDNLGYVPDPSDIPRIVPEASVGATAALASPLSSRLVNRRHASAQCTILALQAEEAAAGNMITTAKRSVETPLSQRESASVVAGHVTVTASSSLSPSVTTPGNVGISVTVFPPPNPTVKGILVPPPSPTIKGILVVSSSDGLSDSPRKTAMRDALALPGQHQRRKAITFLDPEEETLLNQAYDR